MNRKVLLAFCSAILTILIAGAFAYHSLAVSAESEQWVQHTHDVLSKLEDCLLSVEAMGSSYRGFLLTGNNTSLQSFQEQVDEIRRTEGDARKLTADSPGQQRRIDELQALTSEEVQFEQSVIAVRKTDGMNAANTIVQTGRGRQIRQAIRSKVREMQNEEVRLRVIRSNEVKHRMHRAYFALLISVFLGFAVAIWTTLSLNRESLRRLRAERAAKASAANFRSLLDAAPDSMVVLRHDGEIVLLNQQFESQFNYSRIELLGKSVSLFLHEIPSAPLISEAAPTLIEAIAGRAGVVFDICGDRKDGSHFPAEILLNKLETEDGPLLIANIRDVSERREAERKIQQTSEELKRSNMELQQFAYVASHDLQEPLRMVSSYVQLLERRYKGRLDSDADDFIAFALDGSERMKRLIQDLLTYSRAGGQTAPLHQASCQKALDTALANLGSVLEETGALVTHDPLPSLIADHTQISRVFQNLIGNGLKYRSSAPPRIHVSAAQDDRNNWIFSIQDNGIGIEPQYFERIFMLFQRLHGPGDVAGTGIGLSICQKLLSRMGGKIWVDSTLGQGSTFYFSLPENPPAEVFATNGAETMRVPATK